MSRFYYEDIEDLRSNYLKRSPRKAEALRSNAIEGKVTLLPNSNNRAITIETDDDIYLQSYDTLILKKEKKTGKVYKLSDFYSQTTMKHINEFLGTNMGKYDWLRYEKEA